MRSKSFEELIFKVSKNPSSRRESEWKRKVYVSPRSL